MSRIRAATSGRAHFQPNPSGVHFLSAPRVIDGLIRSAGIGEDDLVIDFGAGPGTVTGPLSDTGSRVLAVERDEAFVRQLRRRFAGSPRVSVVHDDLRSVRLPRRPFRVVASIPYAVSTPLLRRLLNTPRRPMIGADLVVEWGFAKRITAPSPRGLEVAWWAARFELSIVRRVPAACFTPAPRVDSAHLRIRRRSGVDAQTQRALWTLLSAAYGEPRLPVRHVLGGLLPRNQAHRLLGAEGVEPARPAGEIEAGTWLTFAQRIAADPRVHCPPLPRRLETC